MSKVDVWTIVETGPWWMDLKCNKCGRLWEFTTEEAINAMNFLECKCGGEGIITTTECLTGNCHHTRKEMK